MRKEMLRMEIIKKDTKDEDNMKVDMESLKINNPFIKKS